MGEDLTDQPLNEIRPGVYRTPDERFAGLADFDFEPRYLDIEGYRMHYIDAGDEAAEPVLMLHGEPTWCYLYRKMITPVQAAGYRVIAPDLIGFGRSDKPARIDTHSYAFHVRNVTRFIEVLDLRHITLVCQDWGSLIGLRVAAETEARFARLIIANGGLPTGEHEMSDAFMKWRGQAQAMQAKGFMPIGKIVARDYGESVIAAYDAPFPDGRYMAGPLAMPLLVPIDSDDPASADNIAAWQVLQRWEKPVLTAFSDGDPITRGGERPFQKLIPGASNQPHTTIENAGHFLQEDQGEKFVQVTIDFIRATPLPDP